jgi:hypothetical protein
MKGFSVDTLASATVLRTTGGVTVAMLTTTGRSMFSCGPAWCYIGRTQGGESKGRVCSCKRQDREIR